jgi:hypothetical protein
MRTFIACLLDSVPRAWHFIGIIPFILAIRHQNEYPHFTDKENEAERIYTMIQNHRN